MSSERRDFWGGFFGIVVFLVGIGLVLLTFQQAYELFRVPPGVALKVGPDKPLDVNATVQSLVGIVVRVLLLLVMAAIGSMIASRGIKLYSSRFGMPAILEKLKGEDKP